MRMLAAVGVIWGWAVMLWPLRLMVISWRGLRVRMMRLILIPVVSWRCRATARAAMTTVRCASIASRVWWKTGRALRSCLLIRND